MVVRIWRAGKIWYWPFFLKKIVRTSTLITGACNIDVVLGDMLCGIILYNKQRSKLLIQKEKDVLGKQIMFPAILLLLAISVFLPPKQEAISTWVSTYNSSCLFIIFLCFLEFFRVFEELYYDTEVDAFEETDNMNITEASSAITIQRSVFATPVMVRNLVTDNEPAFNHL